MTYSRIALVVVLVLCAVGVAQSQTTPPPPTVVTINLTVDQVADIEEIVMLAVNDPAMLPGPVMDPATGEIKQPEAPKPLTVEQWVRRVVRQAIRQESSAISRREFDGKIGNLENLTRAERAALKAALDAISKK